MARSTKAAGAARLNADAWKVAALDQLASHGIDAVRIETLAKTLGVSKGSFYWHFRDRDALHLAMLEHWRRRATLAIIDRLNSGEEPLVRFEKLMRLPFVGSRSAHGANVELAVRLWGRRDHRVREVLEEVDELRTKFIADLLRACGVRDEECDARAILAYCYMRVAGSLLAPDDDSLMQQCESLLRVGAGAD